jgi:hypothetical protein
MDIDDATVAFKSNRGTFAWDERITYVDINNDYAVATAVWTIAPVRTRTRTSGKAAKPRV